MTADKLYRSPLSRESQLNRCVDLNLKIKKMDAEMAESSIKNGEKP
jgi:hypothetical protein